MKSLETPPQPLPTDPQLEELYRAYPMTEADKERVAREIGKMHEPTPLSDEGAGNTQDTVPPPSDTIS